MFLHRILTSLYKYKYLMRLLMIIKISFGLYALGLYLFRETPLPKSSPKLFCFILTNPTYFSNRTKTIYNTWAKKCDTFKFISLIPDIYLNKTYNLNDSIEVDYPFPLLKPKGFTNDVYKKLTDKIYLTLIELYTRYDNYDWYLKADDDTFVFVENLRDFIYGKPLHEPIMYGYRLKTWLSGGAGYLFNRKSLEVIGKKLSQNYKFCPNTGTEDMNFYECMQKLKIKPGQSVDSFGRERFHPFNITTHVTGNYPDWIFQYAYNQVYEGSMCCSDSSISFHYMSVDQLLMVNSLWDKLIIDYKNSSQRNLHFHSILYKMLINENVI